MSTDELTVLDHIDGIAVPGNVFANPANEYWALARLYHGMPFLYRQAAHYDEAMRNQLSAEDGRRVFIWGNHPAVSMIPKPLLTCSFHWYAVSACQYVRRIGAIAYRQDHSRPTARDYLLAVIPDVHTFRDKVAAHFAWTTKNRNDNDADRLASVLPPLAFVNDSFHVGELNVTLRRGDNQSRSGIHPWSICKVHEKLRQRYWLETTQQTDAGCDERLESEISTTASGELSMF